MVLAARRIERLAQLAAEIEAQGGQALSVVLDVTDRASVEAAFDAAEAHFGVVEVVLNNAGIGNGQRPLEISEEDWRAMLSTNLDGVWRVAQVAAQRLAQAGRGGSIVNVASILGLRGVADQTAYTAAKHGVVGFTRALALHLAPRRITVNALCPSWVDTAMAHGRFAELAMTKADADASTPTGRITSPEEVAAACLWLCGPGAANLTGQALALDGGASA